METQRYLFKEIQYVYVTHKTSGNVQLQWDGNIRVMNGAQFAQLVEYGQFVLAPEEPTP